VSEDRDALIHQPSPREEVVGVVLRLDEVPVREARDGASLPPPELAPSSPEVQAGSLDALLIERGGVEDRPRPDLLD
jgi:hypothetical protein